MRTIKKQFSTFEVSYADVEINSRDFWQYGVDVKNDDTIVHLRGGEFRYDTALQIRSDDEQQVREAIAEVIDHRRFWLYQLKSILK
jgi:hypothetical protein